MNITTQQIDELNAVIELELTPADYSEKVQNALKTTAKKVSMPGFRPGKVPSSLIKKMYGRSVFADEINKILNDSLYQYIEQNNIQFLGNPLPKDNEEAEYLFDIDAPQTMKFAYELGLSPKFDVRVDDSIAIEYLTVKADDKIVNEEILSIQMRYGNYTNAEVSENDDLLVGELVQLDANGNVMENGIKTNKTINLRVVADDNAKNNLIGVSLNSTVVINPKEIWADAKAIARNLEIDENIAADMQSNFNFTVKEIKRLVPHEINQELFNKAFGEGVINSEEEMRKKIAGDVENFYVRESDKKFFEDVTKYYIQNTSFELPALFLKRWMKTASEKPITEEQIENEWVEYSEILKWQLIENHIIKSYNLTVEANELKDYAKSLLRSQYAQYGIYEVPEEQLESAAKNALAKKDDVKKLYEQLLGAKLIELFKTKLNLNKKELSFEQFVEQLYKK